MAAVIIESQQGEGGYVAPPPEFFLTNIDLITDPEMDLTGRATKLGEEIRGLFTEAVKTVKAIGDVRGQGS